MTVRVEFYGIPRRRAGVASVDVAAGTLSEALTRAGEELPGFAAACLDGGRLGAGYLANVNGRVFTSDPSHALREGDVVLIVSADAGG